MKKSSFHPSFFKTILFILMVSLFSISSSYGVDQLPKKENVDFMYRVPQAKWSKDVKNVVVDVVLMVDAEDKDKLKMSFLFFQRCDKPSERWLYGLAPKINNRFTPREWRKYQAGRLPLSYDYESTDSGMGIQLKGISYYQMTTGEPIDLSFMIKSRRKNCGQLVAGYGLGITRQEAYNDMLSQKRFNVVFDTRLGVTRRTYDLEVKTVWTANRFVFIETSICGKGFVKGC